MHSIAVTVEWLMANFWANSHEIKTAAKVSVFTFSAMNII